MQELTKTWTPDLINSNTFMLAHRMGGAEKIIEREAFKGALACKAGIIYASNQIEYLWEAEELIKLAEEAGKKAFFVSLTVNDESMGLNPFLTLNSAQITQYYFEPNTPEFIQFELALSKEPKPTTPSTVLKVIRENEVLFPNKDFLKNPFNPITESLEAVVKTGNMLNNLEESINVDLLSIVNEGHVLILGGLDAKNHQNDEIIAFINDYLLKPLFADDGIKQERSEPFYFISSSEAALDNSFILKLLAYGRNLKLHVCFTDYRVGRQDMEGLNAAYSNSHNKIWGVQKADDPFMPPIKQLEELTTKSDVNKILFLGPNNEKEVLSLNLYPFKITYDKRNYDGEGDFGHFSQQSEIIYAVDENAACDVWDRLQKDSQDGESNGIDRCEQQFDWPILKAAVTFRMPDGTRMLKVDTVARLRASKNLSSFNGDFTKSMQDTATFFAESEDNIANWLKQNVEWKDIQDQCYFIQEKVTDDTMQEAWSETSIKLFKSDK